MQNNLARVETQNLALRKGRRRRRDASRFPIISPPWSDVPFWQPALLMRRGLSVFVFESDDYRRGGEAESRRKVDDGDDDACASVRRCASQRVREETGGKWDGGTSARVSAKRRGGRGTARGAAACAHRRALHSACTSERCG